MTTDHAGKKVLGRIRLSREADDAGTSADRQREAIEAWARMHDATVVGWAIDLGVSGGVDPFKTPELGPWLKPDRLPEWDVLVGYRLDRISRRLVPLSTLMEFLKDHDKSLASTSESIDLSTWAGRLVATVLAIVAEGELEAATERNKGSQLTVRKLGRLHSGVVPFGYRKAELSAGEIIWGDVAADTSGWYAVIDPEQARVIREIMVPGVMARRSVNSIADDLNQAGMPTKFGARSKNGEPHSGKWDSTVVRRILGSPALLGYGLHKGMIIRDDDGMPVQRAEPLLSRDEFRKVQERLAERSIRQSPRDQSTNLFTGVAECYWCKGPLYRQVYKARGIVYYRCPKAQGKNAECEHKVIREEILTELSETELLEQIGDIERTDKVYIPASDNTEALAKVQEALDTAREEKDLGLYEGNHQGYLDRVKRLVRRQRELESLPAQPARFEYRGLGETYAEAWKRMNTEQRRGLLVDSGIKVRASGGPVLHVNLLIPHDIRARIMNR